MAKRGPTKRRGGTVRRKGARQSKQTRHAKGATARLEKAAARNIAPIKKTKKDRIDSRVTSFGDVWDTYRLELKHEADISPEAIKQVFKPLQENLRDIHSRQPTLLRVRVATFTDEEKNRATETWVHVSSRVPFGVAFDSIEENVTQWLLRSAYVSFDAIEVSSRRPDGD